MQLSHAWVRFIGSPISYFFKAMGQVAYQMHLKFSKNVTEEISFNVFLTILKLLRVTICIWYISKYPNNFRIYFTAYKEHKCTGM